MLQRSDAYDDDGDILMNHDKCESVSFAVNGFSALMPSVL